MTNFKNRVKINVSGNVFETYETTLQRYPKTLLGDPEQREEFFDQTFNQYFFNRNKHAFEAILFFYQSGGKLSRPQNINPEFFDQECKFYKIPEEFITRMQINEGRDLIYRIKNTCAFKKLPTDTIRQKVWCIFENPKSFTLAKYMFFVQIFTICVSLVLNTMETLPSMSYDALPITRNPWFIMELSLSGWFFLEFIVRLLSTPSLFTFFKSLMNWIDVVAIPPYSFINHETDNEYLELLKILRFFRVLRIFRLMKLSERLRAVMAILEDSLKDLQLFFVCLFIINVFGGSILYFQEKTTKNSSFKSVPDSMWWGLQTFLTLGYGDIVPKTPLGRLCSSLYMVFGLATVSLPVLSLIMKFKTYTEC